MTTLKIELRRAYGRKRYYPACDKSRDLLELVERPCFSAESIAKLEKMGYKVEYTRSED